METWSDILADIVAFEGRAQERRVATTAARNATDENTANAAKYAHLAMEVVPLARESAARGLLQETMAHAERAAIYSTSAVRYSERADTDAARSFAELAVHHAQRAAHYASAEGFSETALAALRATG